MPAIRKARLDELDSIMPVYDKAKAYMQQSGNPNQWIGGYPSRETIAAYILAGHCHVLETDDRELAAVFAYIEGNDPTYSDIFDGAWLNDLPYAVVHRLASAGIMHDVARQCFLWCFGQCPNLRVDTHADNHTMRHILESLGFSRCGIILTHNGTPRIAYQKTLDINTKK